jgi:L-alanine-DL-glutamate epimerase-like enolase superfamily enzyme
VTITWHTMELHTTRPFGIARWTHTSYPRTFVALEHDGIIGRGEAAPNAYYGESRESVEAVLPQLAPVLTGLLTEVTGPGDWSALQEAMDSSAPQGNPSAKCAIEMAVVEWLSVSAGVPAYHWLGMPPGPLPESSYTVGLADLPTMQQSAREAVDRGHGVLKVKVGTPDDEAILAGLREAAPQALLRVDANAAWSRERATRMLSVLDEIGVELLEQPLAADDLDGHAALRRRCRVPIIADESLHSVDGVGGVRSLAEAFDGVNLKIAKLGGPLQARRALELARAHGLRVMVGCMIESSLSIAAAACLAAGADWADLDGALLLADDPYAGLSWQAGRLTRADTPGWPVH